MIGIEVGSVTYRVQQFDVKHGEDAILIEGWYVYSNGAMRDGNPLGPLYEPPGDEYERCKIQVRYREELLRRAVQEFHELKDQLSATAKVRLRHGDPAPNLGEIDRLKKLRSVARERQKELDRARKQLTKSQPSATTQRDEQTARNKQANEEVLTALADIRL